MHIYDMEIVCDGIGEEEAEKYAERAPEGTYRMTCKADGEWVDLTYEYADTVPFERIARITGYLTSSVDRWNDAKRAELRDRVKHTVTKF